jgi:2'-5' RNA ligase
MKPIVNRLFIAMPIHNNIRPILNEWCEQIKEHLPFEKWVHPSDYHITLKYMGEADFLQTQNIKGAIREVTRELNSFRLSIEGIGTFGRTVSPSILWSGLSGDRDSLEQLQMKIEEVVTPLGFQPEHREYNPHVTLARKFIGKVPFEHASLSKVLQPKEGMLQWEAKEVVLYQSHIGRSPMYQPLSVFPLCRG